MIQLENDGEKLDIELDHIKGRQGQSGTLYVRCYLNSDQGWHNHLR